MAVGVGIDIGSRTARVARIVRKGSAISWSALATASRAPDELAERLRESGIQTRGGVVGLSGSSTMLRYTRVPMVPAWKLRMLVSYEATQGGELDASFDYRLLNLPARVGSTDLTVLTAVAKNEALVERMKWLRERGVRGVDFLPDALALYETFSRCPEANESLDQFCLVLDIGATKTEMVIAYNGGLIFARSISFGGDDFTKALATALGVEPDRAERLKVKHGEVMQDALIATRPAADRALLESLASTAEEFWGAVRASLMFARAQTKLVSLDIGRIYLSGAGARLRGLDAFVGGKLNVRASFFRPPDEWRVPGAPGAPGEWMIALGLALLSLDPPEGRMSILPPAARSRRRFWRAGVYAYAAALLFLAAAVGTGWAYVHNWQEARVRLESRAALLDEAKKRDAGLDELLDGNADRRENVQLLRSAACAGATLVKFLDDVKKSQQGPVILSRMRYQPGELNRAGQRGSMTLSGTVGSSVKKTYDVLTEFCKGLTQSPLYDPPDPKTVQLIESARESKDKSTLEFQVRVPVRELPAGLGEAKEKKP